MVKGKSKKSPSKKMNNIEISNKNYNLIKVKSNYLNLLSISIFITALFIFFIGYLMHYLNDLRKCKCFQEENAINKSNIEYLLIIETVTIALNIIILINLINMYMSIDKLKSGGYSTKTKLSIYIGVLIYLIIYGFFVYNVYKLSQNVNEECECTLNPVRYLLYFQATIILIYLIFLVSGVFLI